MKHKSPEQHAERGEKGDIHTQKPGEVPPDQIDQQNVQGQDGASGENPERTPASQSAPDHGVPADFQQRRQDKEEPDDDSRWPGASDSCPSVRSA